MKHAIPLVAALLLLGSPVLPAQEDSKPQETGKPAKPAPRLANPTTIVQQLMRMTPEQRERALEKLPPFRQAQIREQLQRFDNLPREEQERRLRLGEIFANLPPEKQDLVRRQIQAFNQLPDDRRRQVSAAFQRLRRLPDAERRAVLVRDQFRSRFSATELQMIADLSENLPPPSPEPPRP